MRNLIAGLALGLTAAGGALAAAPDTREGRGVFSDQHPVYVQIIVKACPVAATPLEPTNHGKVYDAEKPLTAEQRKAALAEGCIDVPVPMEWIDGEMSPQACRGRAGYLASLQFLRQRQDLAGFPAVGAWNCIETDHQVVGAVSQ
jgi:hypothetical protein